MATFPYTYSANKLPTLFDKIHKTGVPSKVNNDWLKAMGLASSRDRSMTPMLKGIGFIDGSGTPTERWRRWKDINAGPVALADAIRDGYKDIFAVYPDAQDASDSDLRNLINTTTGAGQEMVSLYLSTFKGLSRLAKWVPGGGQVDTAVAGVPPSNGVQISLKEPEPHLKTTQHSGLIVNLNIQLSLPDTLDSAGYEAFFAAMKKHLFPDK